MDAAHKPVILTYHSIAEGPSPLEIPPKIFTAQMEWLAANARVVPLAEIVDTLKGRRRLPERRVVLTFDDGYADFCVYVAPLLLRLKLPATVFLPTVFVGKTNCWPDSSMGEKPLMNWQQVRELAAEGIEFGSHSATHPVLPSMRSLEVLEELHDSSLAIAQHVGQDPKFFCYPYGKWNRKVRDEVRDVYDAACSTGAGVVEPHADPFALPRVDAHYVRDLRCFRKLFTDGFEKYVTLRRWIRRLRGQPEGFYARV